jgi:histidinol phosphatase-like enzyme
MAEIGKSKGANPSEWYATFSPLSINNLDIEIYENGEWHSLKKGDGEFDSELFNRNLEKTFVFKKGKEMEEKMLKEHQANQPKSDAVTDEIEPVPVADKNVSREKPVKEAALEEKPVKESAVEEKPVKESAVEEKPKSKGILSGIKSLFSKK